MKTSTQAAAIGLRDLIVAVVSLAVLAACGEKASTPAATPVVAEDSDDPTWPVTAVADPTALGFSKEGLAALDASMTKAVVDRDVAGLVTILIKDGEVAQFKAYGVQSGDPVSGAPMALDSIFRIYSMSKPITGVAMMQLFEQGKWRLDDPVTKYVPELANLKVLTWKDGKPVMRNGKPVLADPSRPPTMRELMSHTAGFAYGLCCDDPANAAFRDQGVLASKDLDEMMSKIAGIPLLYDPGTRWSYSIAVDIQGYIVQKLSGQRFGEYLQQHVFTPLGMRDTSFVVAQANVPRFTDVYRWDKDKSALVKTQDRPDRKGFTDPDRLEYGGGGLVSTAHDYARLSQMLLNDGELAKARLLRPETIQLMRTNQIGDLRLFSDGTPNSGQAGVGFGLDFAVYLDPSAENTPFGRGTYYWSGAAGTWFWIDPENDLVFVGLIQVMGGSRPDGMDLRNESAKQVYAALQAGMGPNGPATGQEPRSEP